MTTAGCGKETAVNSTHLKILNISSCVPDIFLNILLKGSQISVRANLCDLPLLIIIKSISVYAL